MPGSKPRSGSGIAVGVHVHAEPERLAATLDAVRAHSPTDIELLLLPDGPDAATQACLARLGDLPQHATPEPAGAAACFNRLVRATDAPLLVLLESGALPSPGWLERMLAALDASSHHGLAGPSTNLAWNEQRAFPHAGAGEAERAALSEQARQRFGDAWRTLEPLHSLADFCYLVRREVVEAIGEADERYGPGPCWEMDYNVRAARAGWRGVWACSAFVWRAPFTRRRERDERSRFEASRQLYQDKFCALRLLRSRPGYEPHCRGDACEHFAPKHLIEIRRARDAAPAPSAPLARARTVRVEPLRLAPVASCIMPTGGRPDYLQQSVRYFQRQTFAARELIILDDGAGDAPPLPDDPRIRHVRLPAGLSIGAKRNRGVELARGDFIVHWDDDDWYGPDRLSAQLAPLLSDTADVCGLTGTLFFALPEWSFWRCVPALFARMFVDNVHGGTLAWRRRLWDEGARYPDLSLAEDAWFLRYAAQRGARLARLPGDGLFIYLRHAANSWRFACGAHFDPRGWKREAEPAFDAVDRAFYAARSGRAPAPPPGAAAATPLVSCIMPTADRHRFATRAIEYFLRQGFPARELIIADDGSQPMRHLVPDDDRIHYLRFEHRLTLGAKRNLACAAARGELIVHWDDDDWHAADRLSRHVATMREHARAQVCGLADLYYYDPGARRAWRYLYTGHQRPWVSGNTFCYRKSLWERHRFPDITEGEDTRFVWSLPDADVLPTPDSASFVGIVHQGNTSRKNTADSRWHAVPAEQVRELMGRDVDFYDALAPAPAAPVPQPADAPRGGR